MAHFNKHGLIHTTLSSIYKELSEQCCLEGFLIRLTGMAETCMLGLTSFYAAHRIFWTNSSTSRSWSWLCPMWSANTWSFNRFTEKQNEHRQKSLELSQFCFCRVFSYLMRCQLLMQIRAEETFKGYLQCLKTLWNHSSLYNCLHLCVIHIYNFLHYIATIVYVRKQTHFDFMYGLLISKISLPRQLIWQSGRFWLSSSDM